MGIEECSRYAGRSGIEHPDRPDFFFFDQGELLGGFDRLGKGIFPDLIHRIAIRFVNRLALLKPDSDRRPRVPE